MGTGTETVGCKKHARHVQMSGLLLCPAAGKSHAPATFAVKTAAWAAHMLIGHQVLS